MAGRLRAVLDLRHAEMRGAPHQIIDPPYTVYNRETSC